MAYSPGSLGSATSGAFGRGVVCAAARRGTSIDAKKISEKAKVLSTRRRLYPQGRESARRLARIQNGMKYTAVVLSLCALTLLTSCRPSPQKLLATADKFHANKKYKEAEILYQKVLVKDKKNAEAYYKGGLNLLDEGKAREAAEYLRRAVDLQPSNVDAEAKLAQIYLMAYLTNPPRLKALRPEIDDLRKKMLLHDPNSFDALRIEGMLDLSDRKFEDAVQVFAKANSIHPHSRELVNWYAESLVATNHPEQAEALVKDAIDHDKSWGPGYDFLFLLYRKENDPQKEEQVLRQHFQNDPKNPAAVSNLAYYLAANKRLDEGESVMKTVLSDPKAFPQAHLMMGDFYARGNKLDQAIQQYQAGADSDKDHALPYQERIVQIDNASGKQQDALKLAKSLAGKTPKNLGVAELYASTLVQTGLKSDPKGSISELEKLSKDNSSSSVLHLDLAEAYQRTRDADKALSEALEAQQDEVKNQNPRPAVILPSRMIAAQVYASKGQPAKELEQVTQVLTVQPGNPEARLMKDSALIALNQGDQAMDDLQTLIQQFPKSDDARLDLAQIYMNERKYDQAAQQYEMVWNGQPQDVRGYLGLQTIKFATGKLDEAVKGMSDLVAKDPSNPQFRMELAQIQNAAAGKVASSNPAAAKAYVQQAADNVKEVLKAAPNDPRLWLTLGELQQRLGQADTALASFEQASHLDPRNAGAIVSRAELLSAMNRKNEAVALYNQALGIDPNNAIALNNLAFLNAELGSNLDQAMSFAERAKQQAPKSLDVSDTLGFVYLQKNLNSQALDIFRQDVQDAPQNPMFHLHLAMALLKKGDKEGARTEADKALKMAAPAQQPEIKNFVSQIG